MKKICSIICLFFSLSFLLNLSVKAEKALILLKNKRLIHVDTIRADDNGTLTYKKGKFGSKVRRSAYIYAWVPFTKELKKAAILLRNKKYAQAADAFQKLEKKYKYIGWDVYCIRKAAIALKEMGKINDAIAKLEKLNGYRLRNPRKEKDFQKAKILLAKLYLSKEEFDKAATVLSEVGNAKDPEIAAAALVAKGELFEKQAKYKDAVLCYLQIALLFPKENKERPKSLMKVANLLKQLNDVRGKKFADMLKREYPKSPYIKQLQ